MNLGWRNSEKEFIGLDEASKIFEISEIGKSPSRFNISKLKNINSHFLKSENTTSLIKIIQKQLNSKSFDFESKITKIIHLLLERAETINDLIIATSWFNGNDYKSIFENREDFSNDEIELLQSFINSFSNKKIDSKSEMESHFNNWLAQKNIKFKHIGKPLRICLTGKGYSIDLISILDVLGVEEIINRIKYNLEKN